jgi:group I intron endonuclease
VCLKLEQYYLDLYKPAYNILKIAGSSFGLKHKPTTIEKLQKLHKDKLHPRFGTTPGPVQRALTSLRLKEHFAKNEHHNKGKKGILAPQYGLGGTAVHCYGNNGDYLYFPSVNAAKKHFKVRSTKISMNIYSGKGRPKKVLINGVL